MDVLDLRVQIEEYISKRGLTPSDSIEDLIEALFQDFKDEL